MAEILMAFFEKHGVEYARVGNNIYARISITM